MSDWLTKLQALGREGTACVLVTVAAVKGSAPREAGAKMLVTRDDIAGTIGGGHLEFKAIEIARSLLEAHPQEAARALRRFPLGPSLGQCCGGLVILAFETVPVPQPAWISRLAELLHEQVPCVIVARAEGSAAAGDKFLVTEADTYGCLDGGLLEAQATEIARAMLRTSEPDSGPVLKQLDVPAEEPTGAPVLLFERVQGCDFNIVLFGAGHVGKALISVLSGLPCRITWVDSREEQFPATLPDNVTVEVSYTPEYEVDHAPSGAYFLVMTHSHALDQALCERILRRQDFRYLGLIGSNSKRKRFEKRWAHKGMPEELMQRMTCPIGIPGISGKHPSAIAIAVAAEILQVREHTDGDVRSDHAVEDYSAADDY